MNQLRSFAIVVATISVLALGVFALARKDPAAIHPQGGDVIIIKGGSLSIQCPEATPECFAFDAASKKYNHKGDAKMKVTQVVVKDSKGVEVFNSDQSKSYGELKDVGSSAFTTSGLVNVMPSPASPSPATATAATAPVSGRRGQ